MSKATCEQHFRHTKNKNTVSENINRQLSEFLANFNVIQFKFKIQSVNHMLYL